MIKGAKAGQQQQRQPVIAKDSAASISYLKILYGLSEGEISGLADGAKSIYLDDTPLLDDSGNPNFKDDKGNNAVVWDFRSGTNDQEYIKGFPSVENETNINVELKGGTPYVKTVTNSQLSAVRLRLSWAALRKQETNGDVNGITIEYAIDLSTNGGAYQQVLLTKVSDKTSAKYERSHRIDLPRGNTWNIRVRRITPNATSDLISDKMYVDAITEIIDAKLRYPNTAMLGLQYDAATFSNVAKLSVRCKGKIISVPSNYDPVARSYTGIWNGTFKQAYSNNPAWVYYDICTQWRYGLGNRLTAAMIDKWSLYALGQYCDQQVSDGKGGQEPRFTVNVYLQAQQDAFSVLQSLAAIFRAMSYWQGEQIVLDADLPKDPVYTFSRANVVDGEFSYTGTRARDRHTIAKVAWDNPEQKFKTEYEFVRDEAAIAKYGVKVLDLSIVGCTSQGQSQRAGLWALKSEQLETRTVTFKTGLDGFIPTVGSIINVSDEVLAGRANSGRVAAVSSDLSTITLDRNVVVSVGDTLIVNADNGKAQRRIVSAVSGRNVTVSVAFDGVSSQNVWAVDSSDLKTMRFRVLSIKQDDVTFTITALQHEPQKYDAIDYGAIVEPTSISIIKPNIIDAPKNVVITQRNRVEQGQNITTMLVSWEQVSGAVAYDVEWRKDNGNWTKVPRTGNNSIEIDGVYSGNYLARVAAVSAFDLVSNFATSILTAVAGKVGAPPSLANLKATGILFGMRLDWLFANGSSDTNYTEIQVASAPDTNVALLGAYAYPTNTATINGLQGNLTQYYRARIVDKLGNASPWTAWVKGVTSADANKVLDLLNGQITESQLYQDLGAKIGKISTIETGLSQEIQNRIDAQAQEAIDRSNAITQETENRIAAIKSVNDGITQEVIDRKNGDTETLGVITTYKKSNDTAMAAVQSEIETIVDDQSAMSTKLDGVYAVVTPLTADSNQWTADSSSKQAAAWTLQSAYATADMTLSQKIDNVSATYADNLALVVENYYTKATTDRTIAQKISTFKSEVVDPALNKKADAGALQETTAKADRIDGQLQAASTKLDGVYARVVPLTADSNSWTADSGGKQATAWTLQSAIVDGDSALSQRIDKLDANFKDSAAKIETVNRTFADENKALSGRIDTLDATMKEQSALVRKDIIAISEKNTSLAGTVENIQRSNGVTADGIEVIKAVGDVERVKAEASKLRLDANITALNSLKLQIDTSISKIDDLVKELNLKISKETNAEIIAEYQNQISDLQTKKAEAVAERDGIPARIAKLQSDKATIDSLVKTESDIKSEYTIKMFGNNVIGGFGLALDKNNVFDFAIRADKFYIAPPSGTGNGVSPFMVLTSPQVINGVTVPVGTYIKGDLIATGSVTADKIDTRGLTIKDASGKVLFGSGTGLDVTNITGLGSLATKNTVTTNEVTGLGSLAKVDKLTTSNITTYVEGLGVRNLLVGDAQITSANIGTAQVDTLQIAGEAVTIPRATNTGNFTLGSTRNVATLSMPNSSGATVLFFGFNGISWTNAIPNRTQSVTIVLKCNGNTIKQWVVELIEVKQYAGNEINTYLYSIYSAPATTLTALSTVTGDCVYTVDISAIDNSATIKDCSLTVLGAKR